MIHIFISLRSLTLLSKGMQNIILHPFTARRMPSGTFKPETTE